MMPSKNRINDLFFRNKEADIEAIPLYNQHYIIRMHFGENCY